MELITDIEKYICDRHTSIFTAMQRIEDLGNKGKKLGRANMFLVVCDKNKKLLGTLTDGDIRRGIIKGLNLKSEVQNCMQKISGVLTGFWGYSKRRRTKIQIQQEKEEE